MRLLIDMDGVLADWHGGIQKYLDGDIIDPTRWDLGLTEETRRIVRGIQAMRDFYYELEPIAGAREAMHAIAAEPGIEAWICTTPDPLNATCASDKIDWVRTYLGEHWADRIILTHDKTMIRGDFLIDDKPEITGSHVPEWKQLIFTQPYNLHVEGFRIKDWETYDFIFTPYREGAAA